MKAVFIGLITIYQKIFSGLIIQILGASAHCRYQITCSEYAKMSIQKYGIVKGCMLAAIRILNCQPFGKVEVSR